MTVLETPDIKSLPAFANARTFSATINSDSRRDWASPFAII
jgi:hypothetical protein